MEEQMNINTFRVSELNKQNSDALVQEKLKVIFFAKGLNTG